ncbi:MAG TPA: MBL fold metallo-hydrolase, partial [Aggregatilineales bacterium]|nr:MBL fold metallo-hydrolase [Aggregatilineales bacterium]
MTIDFQILGAAGRDNALFVRIDSGQHIDRLLFDCGDNCLSALSIAEIQAIDHLMFSHLHMDHVGGFDSFFRLTYNRTSKPNMIWGPPETSAIIQHRFRGFVWNIEVEGTWLLNDLYPDRVVQSRFEARELFAELHALGTRPFVNPVLDTPDYSVTALHMDHRTPSMAYIVREKPRLNLDTAKLAVMGLRPGAWIGQVKDHTPGAGGTIELGGKAYELDTLRQELLTETPGKSLAYLTDFLLNEPAHQRLATALKGCTIVVCESQYRQADLDLAQRNYHMTAIQAASLAKDAGIQQLVLFHLSDRYQTYEWMEMLHEARS